MIDCDILTLEMLRRKKTSLYFSFQNEKKKVLYEVFQDILKLYHLQEREEESERGEEELMV